MSGSNYRLARSRRRKISTTRLPDGTFYLKRAELDAGFALEMRRPGIQAANARASKLAGIRSGLAMSASNARESRIVVGGSDRESRNSQRRIRNHESAGTRGTPILNIRG